MRKSFALLVTSALALSACAPSLQEAPVGTSVAPPIAWRTQLGATAPVEARWWDSFGDPQLSRLVEQAQANNPDIRIAKSVVDYIFRFMGISFLAGYKEATSGQLPQMQPKNGNGDSQASGENGSNGNGTNHGNGDGSNGDSGKEAESPDIGVDYAVLERAGALRQEGDGQQGQTGKP